MASLDLALTSSHASPLVASPRRTPVWRSSSIMRVAGFAFQGRSGRVLSSDWPAG